MQIGSPKKMSEPISFDGKHSASISGPSSIFRNPGSKLSSSEGILEFSPDFQLPSTFPELTRQDTTTDSDSGSKLIFDNSGLKETPPQTKLTWLVCGAVGLAVLGSSFEYGVSISVVASSKDVVCSEMDDKCSWDIVVAMFPVGGLLGAAVAATLASEFGRKWTIWTNNLFFVIGALMMALATSSTLLIGGRFLLGIGCGIGTTVVPLYVAEIAPRRARGAFGTSHQLAVTIGILVAQSASLSSALGRPGFYWHLLFGVTAVPSAVAMLVFPFFPETPRFMFARGDTINAVNTLRRLRGTPQVQAEVEDMRADADECATEGWHPALVRVPTLRMQLAIGTVLHAAQQLSGINVVLSYSTTIFTNAGVSNPQLATAVAGGANLVATLIALRLMDRAGRRPLLLVGFAGMAVAYIQLAFVFLYGDGNVLSHLTVASMVALIVAFAVGPGPVPWLMTAELFPLVVRARAVSLCVCVNWLALFATVLAFPAYERATGAYALLPMSALCAAACIFVFFYVPETATKSRATIDTLFATAHRQRSSVHVVPSLYGSV